MSLAASLRTARQAGLLSCHTCGLLLQASTVPGHLACPRCSTPVHSRKPQGLDRCAALTLTAAILYVPANVYPVMSVEFMGRGEPDTILSGVFKLLDHGNYAVAALVFFASVVVPLLKLVGLTYLNVSVRRRWQKRPRDRTVLYRIIEGVGRWSMLDIFMISILPALVKLGAVATIVPGIGATAFAAVVVITMFAAAAFDPRLIWDSVEKQT